MCLQANTKVCNNTITIPLSSRFPLDRGWTVSHGQFVIMGGFILYHNDRPFQVLSTNTFTRLLDVGCIDFPYLPEQDIKIKSRSHPLLAAVTLLQATWFIIQCIARGVRGLDITQLEAITIVLIGVNALLLRAWWNKPLDARSFVRIDARFLPSVPDASGMLHDDDGIDRDFARQSHSERGYLGTLWNIEFPVETEHSLFSSFEIKPFASKLFTDYEQLYTAHGSKIHLGDLTVPIFYAPMRYASHLFRKTMLGLLFASPYLAMSACHFPSPYLRGLWRVTSLISFGFSSLFTTGCFLICIIVIIFLNCATCIRQGQSLAQAIVTALFGPRSISAMLVVLVVTSVRIGLIIEAFICLKSSNTTARLGLVWTDLIPHAM